MSRRALTRLAALLFVGGVLFLAAYLFLARDGGAPLPLLGGHELEVTTADRIDSLAAVGAPVSITGTVVEQGGEGSPLLVDDGTDLISVLLPGDSPRLTGHRLFARGPLVERDGRFVLEAVEWLYDSTAVPVHSD